MKNTDIGLKRRTVLKNKYTNKLDSNVGASHTAQINPFLVSAEDQSSVKYKPRIWGNIETTEDFLYTIEVLEIAKEQDIVELHISSYGGCLDAISTLIHAMQKCEAHLHVVMTGTICSAGTLPMFFSDSWEAGEYTSFLFHDAIVGAAPETMSANKAYTSHVQSFYGDMLRSVYKGFFTEEEFSELFNGRQWWMRAPEVEERFKRRIELLESDQDEDTDEHSCKEGCSCSKQD